MLTDELTDLTFVVADETEMRVDIRPDPTALTPIAALPADQHPALVYLAQLAPGSHRTMAHALNQAADVLTGGRCDLHTCPWHMLRYQHTAALRAWLLQNVAAATGNKTLSAVRGTLKECWRLGTMPTDAYMRAIDLKAIKGERPDAAEVGRAIEAGELRAMLRCCETDPTPAGPRDAAILGVAMLAGLRRAEIAGLELRHYDAARRTLTVTGKRNKTRIVPIAPGLAAALDDWLRLRGMAPGALFAPVRKDGLILSGGITPAAVYGVMEKRRTEAGVEPFTPHDLRRTFAGDLLDAGADIVTVQKLMGHANANTTSRYDRRGARAKQAAVGKLHMAWKWKGRE